MKTIKSNEFIILRLPPVDENSTFVYQTFGVMQYVFYDDRFLTEQLKDIYPEKFNKSYYDDFREKCLLINNEEVSFNINEYIYLAKIIDFVSKSFIGDPFTKLKGIMNDDFKDDEDFDIELIKDWYLKTATKFFNGFKESCSNKKLLAKIDQELNWGTDL